jgi:cytochrome oxidase assembly protein ShyY1
MPIKPMVKRSSIVFGILALFLAVLFARLGLWQLERRAERVETNAVRASRGALPELRVAASPPESGVVPIPSADSVAWRRVRARGRFDIEREIILRARSRDGSPGVELLTPLLVGSDPPFDPAILILRGWLPAPDGLRPPPSLWSAVAAEHTPEEIVEVEGIAVPGAARAPSLAIRVEIEGKERVVLSAANLQVAQEHLPYQVAGFYVRATASGATGSRLAPPRQPQLGEGPHLAYALQWFSFAIIALVGTGIYLRKEHGR